MFGNVVVTAMTVLAWCAKACRKAGTGHHAVERRQALPGGEIQKYVEMLVAHPANGFTGLQ
jgi:hypothetical protein